MSLPWIIADFNEVFSDNQLIALVKDEPVPPVVAGDQVVLYDDEGSICAAIVMERREEAILCKLDWSAQGPFASAQGALIAVPLGDPTNTDTTFTRNHEPV